MKAKKETKPQKVMLALDAIRLHFQGPECLSDEVVCTCMELHRSGKKFRPARVRFEGTSYLLQEWVSRW